MVGKSKVEIEKLSIHPKATWLIDLVSQLLSDNHDNHFVPSSVDSEAASLLISFLHDIKCLEYSHTPLAKMQLLTSAFRKCGTILSSVKAKSSWVDWWIYRLPVLLYVLCRSFCHCELWRLHPIFGCMLSEDATRTTSSYLHQLLFSGGRHSTIFDHGLAWIQSHIIPSSMWCCCTALVITLSWPVT